MGVYASGLGTAKSGMAPPAQQEPLGIRHPIDGRPTLAMMDDGIARPIGQTAIITLRSCVKWPEKPDPP